MSELLPELLERCRGGDRDAATVLVQRFYRYALTLAEALLNDAHLAEDAVQEAMVRMLRQLGQLRDSGAFAGWLRQIVRTEANRLRRQRGQPTGPAEQMQGLPDPRAGSPSDRAQLDELQQRVRLAVASLPDAGEQTARLYYLDELSQSEIATRLDAPLGTIKRRLHDARGKLRDLLKPSEDGGGRNDGLPF